MESNMKSPALTMRILKYAFAVSGILFVYIAFKILAKPQQQASEPMQVAISLVGLWCVVGGFYVPRWIFRRAENRSQSMAVEVHRQRWMARGLLSLAYFEACILFGFALHIFGGHNWIVGLLMGAGIGAELLWNPGEPPSAEDGQSSRV